MGESKGYYSLIQYCPDRSRLEVANVGVMLFCPELHFLKARVAKGNDRVRRIFKVSGDDLARIAETKRSITERLEVEGERLPTLEDMQRFIVTRGNDIVLTQLRPMKVMQPEADLQSLFRELVGEREKSSQKAERSNIPELDAAFQSDRIKDKITRNLSVQIPVIDRHIFIPYAFRNGKQNLIKPQRFSAEKKEVIARASNLAFEGSLLFKHPENHLNRELIVVTTFDEASPSLMGTVEELFHEYDVRHIPLQKIEDLAEEIYRAAHL